jgi:type IV pilus assembly protein PilA
MQTKMHSRSGFTLIELVVVIGILAVLLTIVLVAINPSRQFKQANDTKRRSDINAILNAVSQYSAEHKGGLPGGITTAKQVITDTTANICSDIVPTYISALPVDPGKDVAAYTNCGTGSTAADKTYDSGYSIQKDGTGRITVFAPGEVNGEISVTR